MPLIYPTKKFHDAFISISLRENLEISNLSLREIYQHNLELLYVVKINCLRKIKEERKRSNTQIKNTRIYVVRQYAYIHRRRQGESFTKKIERLQQWYQDSLKEPKPQIHPNSLSHKNNQEKPFSNILIVIMWHLSQKHTYKPIPSLHI